MAQPRIVDQRKIIPLALLLCFPGAGALALGVLFVAGGALRHLLTWELVVGGGLLYAAGLRPRVVWLDADTGALTFTWGRRWPLTYARLGRETWADFTIREHHPVVLVSSRTGSVDRYQLPPAYRLRGLRRGGGSVLIADCASEAEATSLRAALGGR